MLPQVAPTGSNVSPMPESGPDVEVEVARHIAEAAAQLQQQLPLLSAGIRESLEVQIPELKGDARVMELLGPSVESNVDTLLHAMRYAIPVQRVAVPAAALEYARRLAQYGVPVHALVRAYRLGQHGMNELVFAQVRTIDVPEAARYTVLQAMSATLFEYIDWITQQVIEVYEDERERWLENQNSLRAMRVRDLLTGGRPVDVDAATMTIRYPLQWQHLAVVMWYPDVAGEEAEIVRLQRFLRDLGQAAGADGAPLFVAADRTCGWGWLPYRAAPVDAEERVRQFAAAGRDVPNLAVGTVGGGVDGFRRSHREAGNARQIALIAQRAEPMLITAGEPGLSAAALLGGDIEDAREYVARTLGALAADTEADARLRDTLEVFLSCGSSYKHAAEELNMHFNTVKYRVGRAVDRLGREIAATDRLAVEIALLICRWYGDAVLSQAG
ncbi:DNA-binding PucR family transcriptional regulator [Mycobacterium sp. MAA66]